MGKVTIFARMGVEPENAEQVKALALEACRRVRDESGTLMYEWHYSEANDSLVVLEAYADSAAHLTHMQAEGHGEMMAGLMALIGSIEFYVLGEPSAEHASALAAVPGAQFYAEIASK